MAVSSITRARKRSAKLAANRVAPVSQEIAVSEHVTRARADFGYFCCAMGKPPAAHMLVWHQEFVTGQSNEHLIDIAGPDTCLLSPRGPLDLRTEVATPEGWRPLRSVARGSFVYDSNGLPTKVINTVRYGRQDCWEVVMSDGTSITCDDSHRWRVQRYEAPDSAWKIKTLQELRTILVTREDTPEGRERRVVRPAQEHERPWLKPNGSPRWRVPLTGPVAYEPADLPIDPYVMGVLIGRGSLSSGSVRFTGEDQDVLDRMVGSVPDGCAVRETVGATKVWSIVGNGEKPDGVLRRLSSNPILPPLEFLGLRGVPMWERPMPEVYLMGSVSQRVAFLQGLMDSGGQSRKGGTLTFAARSTAVAEGLVQLARSLGGIAMQRHVRMNRKRFSYIVEMHLPESIEPFHSCRKAARYERHFQARRPYVLSRSIIDIRPAGKREIGCITVESPLHDFVVKDYAVSCNSAKSTEVGLLCSWAIGRHTLLKKLLRILYVSFVVDVARGKSQAIKATIESPEYQEIFPMVRLSKNKTADELWSIDFRFADIDIRGEDAFTLACAGLAGAITSKRSNLVILDDLIKSEESIKNPDTRRSMEKNWNSVIVPTMFQGARAIALGTRFHFDDIFATTFTEKNGWHVVIQQALIHGDDGEVTSYWEDMWALKYLLGLQQKDPISFAYQYMNEAVQSRDLGIGPELFLRGTIPDSFDVIGVGMDLSSGLRERNDYTVFMLGGRDGDKAYVIDKRRIRCMGNIEKIEALCELLHEWNLVGVDSTGRYTPTFSEVTIWAEAIAYQKSFQGDFQRIAHQEWGLTNLRVSPVTGLRGDKLARFRGVMGLLETQRVVFNKYRDFRVVFDEVMNLGHSSHDDCADALQILLEKLFLRGGVEIE